MFLQSLHLEVTQIGSPNAVFKPVMSGTREHIVVWSELEDMSQSLHGLLVDEHPADIGQLDLTVHNIAENNWFVGLDQL